jgi:hypothetical protein
MEQYRQGDVLLERVKAIPATAAAEANEAGRVVLAYGEVTGHSHAFDSPWVCLFRETGSDGVSRSFIRVGGDAPVALRHEEHAEIPIPPGDYEVVIQREYYPDEIIIPVGD